MSRALTGYIILNMMMLTLQRQIYDDSAVYSFADSDGVIRTEVSLQLAHSGLFCLTF